MEMNMWIYTWDIHMGYTLRVQLGPWYLQIFFYGSGSMKVPLNSIEPDFVQPEPSKSNSWKPCVSACSFCRLQNSCFGLKNVISSFSSETGYNIFMPFRAFCIPDVSTPSLCSIGALFSPPPSTGQKDTHLDSHGGSLKVGKHIWGAQIRKRWPQRTSGCSRLECLSITLIFTASAPFLAVSFSVVYLSPVFIS